MLEALFFFVVQNIAGSYIRNFILATGTCRDLIYKFPMSIVLMQSRSEIFCKSTVYPSVHTRVCVRSSVCVRVLKTIFIVSGLC